MLRRRGRRGDGWGGRGPSGDGGRPGRHRPRRRADAEHRRPRAASRSADEMAHGPRDRADHVRPCTLRAASLGRRRCGVSAEGRDADDLEQAIKVAISGGGNVLSPRVIQNLFDAMEVGGGDKNESHSRPSTSLTQRETDILALLAEGKSNRDISRALFLSEKTVKAHLAAVFRKLGVSNRTQAAMAAVSMGIGPTPFAMDPEDVEPSNATTHR